MRIKSLIAAMGHQMSQLLVATLIATAWLDAHAQSSLPPCPVSGYKHNCNGTETVDSF